MSLQKKIWKMSRFDKGISNLNAEGTFWWLQNLDPETTPPYLRVAQKMFRKTDSVATPELTSMPIDGTIFGKNTGGIQVFNWMMIQGMSGNAKFFRLDYPTWTHIHTYFAPSQAFALLGDSNFLGSPLGTETGYMYFTTASTFGRYRGADGVWDDAFQLFPNSYTLGQSNRPMAKFLKFICVGCNNNLCVWDQSSSTWYGNPTPPRIVLPGNFDIRWLVVLTDWLVIGAYDITSNGFALFFWDGISGTYNRVLRLPNVPAPAAIVDNNHLYVITGDGWINYFDGSGLVKLNRFPDIEPGDISFYVNPNAIKVHKGMILIGKAASGFNAEKRYYAGGIWVFNPRTHALYFRNTLSHGGITNVSGYGVTALGTIMLTPNNDEFYVGWDKGGGSDRFLIDVNDDNGSFRPYNWNAIVVSPMFDDEPYRRKKFIQEVLNFWKPMPDSGFARYVVKYNTTEKYQKHATFASGGSNTYFTVSFGINNFEVGDEVTVVAGNGAGQIRHIASIDTALNRVTVDETLYNGESYDNTSYILLTPFKKIAVIKGSENVKAVNKLMRYNARAKKIQIKIEIWSTSGSIGEWDMGLRDISTIYMPDRFIK